MSIPLVSTIATVLLVLAQLNSVLSDSTSKGASCRPTGFLKSNNDQICNQDNGASCCKAGEKYPQVPCSPSVTKSTPATMTFNGFKKGGDGGGQSNCDEKFHSDEENIVALSTGWYDGGSRCSKNIRINANGRSVLAKVVDECERSGKRRRYPSRKSDCFASRGQMCDWMIKLDRPAKLAS